MPPRDRLAHAERIADGEHLIANFEEIGVREAHGGELDIGAFDLQDSQIGALVLQEHFRVELARVRQRNLDLGARVALDDVVVRHDNARRSDDDAGAKRVLRPLAMPEFLTEELFENRIVERRIAPHALMDINIHHRGRGQFHHRRVRKDNLLAAVGNFLYGLRKDNFRGQSR